MSSVNFHEYLTEMHKDLKEPDDPSYNPYSSRHGQDGRIAWVIMSQFPKRIRNFQLGCAYTDAGFPVLGMYAFGLLASSDDGDHAVMVDAGGRQGQAIAEILKAYPQIDPKRMVLQDLLPPLEQVKAEKTLPAEVQTVVHDFWTPHPVKAANADKELSAVRRESASCASYLYFAYDGCVAILGGLIRKQFALAVLNSLRFSEVYTSLVEACDG